ncbi:MAG: hypothetical protein KDE27_16905 [Planctomycetes bacterium]|nr:hypothetical protein [Planctomycetota bacterium]
MLHPCRALLVLLPLFAIDSGATRATRLHEPSPPIDWRSRVERHLDDARDRVLAACREQGLELPADFLSWIDGDPLLRASVYGCRNDPLRVVLGLRSLEIDLGTDLVRRDYPQLALAFAIQGSYGPTPKRKRGKNEPTENTAPPLPDISPRPPLQLVVPGDPRLPVDTKDPNRELDAEDHIINFLEDHDPVEVEVKVRKLPPLEYDADGKPKPRGKKEITVLEKQQRKPLAADVIASAELQREFNAYMQAHGHEDVWIDCGDRAVHWYASEAIKAPLQRNRIRQAYDLFHDAYRHKGRMPLERDAAPTPAQSMAWLVRNDRHPFADADRTARKWPRFPLDAPWPVLMMLAADDQPLREREDIWIRFRDQGEMRTYGEYIGGIAQQFDMQSARRLSPFAYSYGSIQMMWKDGGVCGTMGNIGARTYRICGMPSSTAGQPGHCALVRMQFDPQTGRYTCRGGQYATGGDEATTVHAGWNYDDVGGRRPMVFHQSVAWGVDHGFRSYVETLVMRRAFDALDAGQRAREAIGLVRQGLAHNPFAIALVVAAADSLDDPRALVRLCDTFTAALDAAAAADEFALYRTTGCDLIHARIAALPAPDSRGKATTLLQDLERQGCNNAKLLAACWRAIDGDKGFERGCRESMQRYLASPARTRNNKESKRFAQWLQSLARCVPGKQRKAWADSMLQQFASKEALVIGRKRMLDPAVAALCKVAGREPPSLDALR